jgi:hypothetical protein
MVKELRVRIYTDFCLRVFIWEMEYWQETGNKNNAVINNGINNGIVKTNQV